MTVHLGIGLIGIGRPWGFVQKPPPSAEQVHRLLRGALDLGITVFDTAAPYGGSEQRLGT